MRMIFLFWNKGQSRLRIISAQKSDSFKNDFQKSDSKLSLYMYISKCNRIQAKGYFEGREWFSDINSKIRINDGDGTRMWAWATHWKLGIEDGFKIFEFSSKIGSGQSWK